VFIVLFFIKNSKRLNQILNKINCKKIKINSVFFVMSCYFNQQNSYTSVLNFTIKAPIGHLPAIVRWGIATSPQGAIKIYIRLFSRCEECNL
jgi:hypothetical protein